MMRKDNLVKSFPGERVKWGGMTPEAELLYLQKAASAVGDATYARSIDIRIPHGYHAQVKKAWELYEEDRIFRYLIDRCLDFGANGFEWELPIGDVSSSRRRRVSREHEIWDFWARSVNCDVPNVLPGIDEINKWIIKHLLLNGMCIPNWQWETVEINGVRYELPMKLTVHNPLSVILDRANLLFMDEKIYLKLDESQKKILEERKDINQVSSLNLGGSQFGVFELKQMGKSLKNKIEAFAIKYNWTPGDNTALILGKNVEVGQGLYPTPPFTGLNDMLVLRQSLRAADIAILDGIINYIIDWEIGDNTKIKTPDGGEELPNQPMPAKYDESGALIEKSSVEYAQEAITSDTRGPIMQIFHPYYYKLNLKMPDVTALINGEKYTQSIMEIFLAFGILIAPLGQRMDFTDINTANFEQMLENIRLNHVKRFWESLASWIIKRNKNRFSVIPNMIFNPLNTQTAEFKKAIRSIAEMGRVSSETLLKYHNLDKKVELARIKEEREKKQTELFEENVPTRFKQSVKGKADNKTFRQTGFPGRPEGGDK